MSVIIKDMTVPQTCGVCKLKYALDCNRWKRVRSIVLDRHRDCPIAPVPQGRLVDANALEVISYCGIPQGREDTFDSGVMWLLEQIDLLPTIIPVEEGKPCDIQ